MKKILAFVSSLLLVMPSFGQDAPKDKTTGVSKVKPQATKPAPAATNAKPAMAQQKNAANLKSSSNLKSTGNLKTSGK